MAKDKTIRVFVNLGGHIKRFGSGWRNVEVLANGKKWTQLRYAPCAIRKKRKRKKVPLFAIRGKVLRSVWDKLPKKELM